MKTGNAAAFPVLSGSGPAVLQHGFRDLGVFGSAGVRGAARPPDGVKGQSAPCRRRHPFRSEGLRRKRGRVPR